MIDSHFHIWRLERGDYGWLTPDLEPIHRDVSLEDWQKEAASCGVTRGILVQAAPTEAETAFLLAQAAQNPAVLGVVGWVDMEASDAEARIERLAREPLLLGLRPMLHDIKDPDWILRPKVQPALAAMARLGLTFDALVRPLHLPRILSLAKSHPALRIVVDHGAKPGIASGLFDGWAADMERIANRTTAFCKLSGLLTEAGPRPDDARLQRYVEHMLRCFGGERLLWGSDWPVLELADRYASWHAMAVRMVPPADRAAIFEQTALHAYPRAVR